MFKDEAIQKSFDWNLRRCENPKKLLRFVKRDFLYKTKNYMGDSDEEMFCANVRARLSQEGFNKLKDMCQKEGIILSNEQWEGPFPTIYCFELKIR